MFYVRRKVGQDSYEVVDTTDWVSLVIFISASR